MSELLQEFVDSRRQRLRVDREAGIIRGVKLLGLSSRNGRRYREHALVEAVGLYEGAKVNINHPKGHPLAPRDYQDRLGEIRGVEFRAGDGLFGDLHFNPKHALSEQLVWDAEHAPQNVGLSHNVLARTARSGDETVVEAITKVQSIDLVADPASTAGLFEHAEGSGVGEKSRSGAEEKNSSGVEQKSSSHFTTPLLRYSTAALDDIPQVSTLTLEELQLHRPDLARELREAGESHLAEIRTQLDQATAREATVRRRERIVELLEELGLPLPWSEGAAAGQITSEEFLRSLLRAADDQSLRRLVEERAELVRSAADWTSNRRRNDRRPRSRDQVTLSLAGASARPRNSQEFAVAVRGR
jgi:hypothetical protein